jgi:phospho-N-acetylmuramoyl-pentapeptide-transferase
MLSLTFIITVILVLLMIPLLKKLHIGQEIRDDGPKAHLIKQGTPTMGGIVIFISIVISTIICYVYLVRVADNLEVANRIIPFLLTTAGFFMIGFIDDFRKLILKNAKGLSPKYKMLGLLIVSAIFIVYITQGTDLGTGTYIPILNETVEFPVWIYIPFGIFVFAATTNAINLTDGVDGLATSVSLIIIACLAVIGIKFGMLDSVGYEVVLFASVSCGACLGFLLFNLHNAKIFMGDTGSLMLGGIIPMLAIYLQVPIVLVIIAIMPVLETISVILQVIYFKKTGKRIFKMAPLHHHFELSGWNENRIVAFFSAITFIVCVIAVVII